VGEIDGVDLSTGMLEAARERVVYRSLREGEVGDTGLDGGAYELVVSSLVDEHLADLRPLYAEAARLGRPGGRFVIVGFHPHFIIGSGMPTHFDDAEWIALKPKWERHRDHPISFALTWVSDA
jgi:SAM-dependent methyltransferase